MPKINRIRIVNFSYNDNNRHIIDETFNFYGGENALLSLANGGGKSVLVQAMLQPILPKITMLGRKFTDFFQGKSHEPTYIMIEWKLDDGAGYLLTGIAISKSASYSANEEDQNSDIRYYTFMKSYEEANDFDIVHIPVTEEKNNKIRIASYMEFNKLLKKETDKSEKPLFVFNSQRDEQRDYERRLNSYNISKEEWKELIVKINDNEYGVSEVFSQCKTSKAVMDKWIIRYIEKVLNKSQEGDHKKLENMMFQVAQSMVTNENHIKDYNIIEQFLIDVVEIDVKTKEVIHNLDSEEKLKSKLVDGYQSLLSEEENLEQLIISCDDKTLNLKKELELIALEETSKEIHLIDEEIQEIDILLKEINEKIECVALKKQHAIFNINAQAAAEKLGQLKEKQIKSAELNEEYLNASKNEEQLLRDMNSVQYSLNLQYEELLNKYMASAKAHYENKEILLENQNSNDDKLIKLQNKIDNMREELGKLRIKIEIFEKEETIIWDKLNIALYRNVILKELDNSEVENIKKIMKDNIDKFTMDTALNEHRVITIDQDIEALHSELNELRDRKSEYKSNLVSVNKDIKVFEKDKKVMHTIANSYRLNEDDIYNRDYFLKLINEKKNGWLNKEFNLKNNMSNSEKIIRGIKDGVSYLPEALLSALREKDISIFTGEKYLRGIDETSKEILLKKNPLLPYSIIASGKEYNQIVESIEDMDITSIIPIINHINRDEIFEGNNKVTFLTHPRSIYVGNKDLDGYISKLIDSLEFIQLEIVESKRVIEECNKDYQITMQFNYIKSEVCDLYNTKEKLEAEIKELDKSETETFNDIKELEHTKEIIKDSLINLGKQLEKEYNMVSEFESYLLKDKEYTLNVKKEIELRNSLEDTSSNRVKVENEQRIIFKNISEIEEKIRNTSSLKEKILLKYKKTKEAKATEIIDGTLEELEGKLFAYESKRGHKLSDIMERLKDLDRDIEILDKEISELNLIKEDYINVIFSKELKAKYNQEKNLLETEEKHLDMQDRDQTKNIAKLSGRREPLYRNLNNRELIPIENIIGNFKERINKAKSQMSLNEKLKVDYQNQEKKIIRSKSLVENKIPTVKHISYNENVKMIENIITYIDELINEYQLALNNSEKEINVFNKISNKFRTKNMNLEQATAKKAYESILDHIDSLDRSYDKYYYLYERFQVFIKSLNDYKSVMDEMMNMIEHSRKDLIEHAFMEAGRIYDEIPKVSENSTVEIDGVRRKILDIKFEVMLDKVVGKEKMYNYINESLNSLITTIKNEVDEGKIRREIEKNISTRELLNVISNLDKCEVRSFKVDINEKNRKMRTWEEVVVKNSGAEKFMAYFSLLVALISYSRRSMKSSDMFGKKEESKVLIMDNPFGAITSGHLLKPLFEIANKYNTQLICLSDIKQGSVINSFNLVYMIKIRQNMMKEDFIELEPIMKSEFEMDEKLEKAYLYTSVEQTSLFGGQ